MPFAPTTNDWILAGYIAPRRVWLTDGQILKLTADTDVRHHLTELLRTEILKGDPAYRELQAIAAHCSDMKLAAESALAMTHDGGSKAARVWQLNETRAREVIQAWRRRVEVSADLVNETMARWLRLSIDIRTHTSGRHEVDGITIVGGIIQPTAGRPR